MSPGTPMGPLARAFFALGLGVCAFGVAGLIANQSQTKPLNWLLFLFGSLFAHDGLWIPIVVVGSFVLVVVLPVWATPFAQASIYVAACAVLITIPALTGKGELASEPSLLPNDYPRNLAIVVGVILAAGLALALRRRRSG